MTEPTTGRPLAAVRREIERARNILLLAGHDVTEDHAGPVGWSRVSDFLNDEEHYAATGSLLCTCPNCPRSRP